MEKIRNPRKVSSMMGFGVFGMLVVWYVAANVMSVLLARNFPSAFESPWTAWLLNDVPLYFLGVPVMLLIFKFIPNGNEPERQRHKLTPLRYLLVVIFCLGCMYTISFPTNIIIMIIDSFKSSGGTPDGISTLTGGSSILQNILFGACVPALGEEFVFRYMFRRKLKGASDKIYILVSAVCFAMFHANFAQIGYAFVLGIVFAWLYTYTGNIWLPVSLHFIANMFGIVLMPTLAGYNENAYLLAFFGLIGGAIALFCVWRKRVFATWQPPTEAGWPYKPPKSKTSATHYYIDPMTGRPVEVSQATPQPAAYYAAGYPYAAPGAAGYPAYPAGYTAPPYGAQAPFYSGYGMQPPYGAPPAAYPPPSPAAYPYYGQQPYTAGGYASPYGGAPAAPSAPGPAVSSTYGAPAVPPVASSVPAAAAPSSAYASAAPTGASAGQSTASLVPVTASGTAAAAGQPSAAPWGGAGSSATGTEPAPVAPPSAPAEAPIAAVPAASAASSEAPAAVAVVSAASAVQVPQAGSVPYAAPLAAAPAPQQPVAYANPYTAMPYGYPVAPLKSAFRVCIVNGGMLTYLIATTLLTLINLFL